MSSRKGPSPSGDSGGCSSKLPKRQVRNETLAARLGKDHQSMVWLCADMDKSTLWCAVCWKYENQLSGTKTKNFSVALADLSSLDQQIRVQLSGPTLN